MEKHQMSEGNTPAGLNQDNRAIIGVTYELPDGSIHNVLIAVPTGEFGNISVEQELVRHIPDAEWVDWRCLGMVRDGVDEQTRQIIGNVKRLGF
jgi:hypothetical protein